MRKRLQQSQETSSFGEKSYLYMSQLANKPIVFTSQSQGRSKRAEKLNQLRREV